jgi:hypothetical protein
MASGKKGPYYTPFTPVIYSIILGGYRAKDQGKYTKLCKIMPATPGKRRYKWPKNYLVG